MDILNKITTYRVERNWSEYELAEKSGLAQSTISSWYRKNMLPSIPSLAKICTAYNITLAQFLASEEDSKIPLTQEQLDLINAWNRLSLEQQNLLLTFLKSL